ncbi:hypothetical protein EYF80_002145 [Liparis tanakae]|uniref:Uncharacterized protein n=1 Tax=Liparis tanakae TaxID=230148 RepID=A0A4Z2JCT1_9TELE|nr:hypothetical protein EYF80_002145 [Liparis tanakae]
MPRYETTRFPPRLNPPRRPPPASREGSLTSAPERSCSSRKVPAKVAMMATQLSTAMVMGSRELSWSAASELPWPTRKLSWDSRMYWLRCRQVPEKGSRELWGGQDRQARGLRLLQVRQGGGQGRQAGAVTGDIKFPTGEARRTFLHTALLKEVVAGVALCKAEKHQSEEGSGGPEGTVNMVEHIATSLNGIIVGTQLTWRHVMQTEAAEHTWERMPSSHDAPHVTSQYGRQLL